MKRPAPTVPEIVCYSNLADFGRVAEKLLNAECQWKILQKNSSHIIIGLFSEEDMGISHTIKVDSMLMMDMHVKGIKFKQSKAIISRSCCI